MYSTKPNGVDMEVRIDNFSGKKASVFGVTTRGEEIQVGYLVAEDDGFHFRYNRGVAAGVTGWISAFWHTQEFAALKTKAEEQYKASLRAESEFYLEVKEALVAEGRAEHVAANLINTEMKLMEQAKRLAVI
jgi:hypothetical protein